MQNRLRSLDSVSGRRMSGARSLWRANGMKDGQFGKPVVAIANSFTQFVPGHVHLHGAGQEIKHIIESLGCFAAEFNTIAIDDGIAMGHNGMLYSLPSRELIADSIEYMVNAHCADALVCISNCDKITPGMMLAAARLNIPTVFVSGGPMESGLLDGKAIDLADAIVAGGDDSVSDADLLRIEKAACPTCGSCSGIFTANSMNCLNEVLGLALPGNGTIPATHTLRRELFRKAANRIVEMAIEYYENGVDSRLPRRLITRNALLNAMTTDIAMGGSTNTVLHLLALASEAGVDFTLSDINELSLKTPCICKISPNSGYHMDDLNKAGGVYGVLGELEKSGLLHTGERNIMGLTLKESIRRFDIMKETSDASDEMIYLAAGGRIVGNRDMASQSALHPGFDRDRKTGCIRDIDHAYSKDGGLAVLYGNIAVNGCVVKTAGIDKSLLWFSGAAVVFDSQEQACEGILSGKVHHGNVVVIRYEGPKGGPGMQEMLYPTSYLKSKGLEKSCALITDGRFSGGSSGLSVGHISPEAAAGGEIALIHDGDIIEIDVEKRRISLKVDAETIVQRLSKEIEKEDKAFLPVGRIRKLTAALKIYAHFVSSADRGAVRIFNT